MRAWELTVPGPADDRPLRIVRRPVPEPGPDELLVRVIDVRACAAPTCTWPRATCRRASPAWSPATRWSARSARPGAGGQPAGGRATGSASPGCATPAGVPVLPAGRREPVPGLPLHRLGRRRRLRRVRRGRRPTSPTGCPTATRTLELAPLLCAGIIGWRALRRADAAARRAARRLRVRRLGPPHRPGRDRQGRDGARADPVAGGPAARAGPGRGLGRRRRRRPAGAAGRGDPVRPGRRARPGRRWRPSTGAARWPSPASTSPTFPALELPAAPVPGAQRCAASPPTPGRTAATSWPSRPSTGSG